MSLPESKIFIKKTSKHPRESNARDFYEEVALGGEQNVKKNADIFSMQNIFINEPKTQATSKQQSIMESAKHPTERQKQRTSIASMKRAIEEKRKRRNKPKLPQKDLSLIEQSQREYNNTSSSLDSIMNESSIEDIETSSLSYSEKSFDDDKMNEGFIDQLEEDDDALNKTVVMYKKKTPREYNTPQKQQRQLAEHQLQQLHSFAKQNSLETLNKLYYEGKLSENQYLCVLEIKKKDERVRKEGKFNQNLTQIQKIASIIDENYRLLHEKLQKDTINDSKKLKDFTKNIIDLHNKDMPTRVFNLSNPEQSKLQLQTLQILAQLKAKQRFTTILKDMRQTFQSEYNKCIEKIELQKNSRGNNFSQNLIFTEIKQLIKTNKEIYLYFQQSLFNNNRRDGQKSLIFTDARKHYLSLLAEKYSNQLLQIEQFKSQYVQNEAVKLMQDQNTTQFSEELSIQLFNVELKVFQQLSKIKQQFLQHLVWLRIIREKGELNQGKIFRQAAWILSNNQPLNVPVSKLKEKFLISNFKFYRKNVFKKISYQFETIKQWFQFSNTKKQVQKDKVEKKKKQHVINYINALEKKVLSLESNFQKNVLQNAFMRGFSLKPKTNDKIDEYFQALNRSIDKMKDLQQKASLLLLIQSPKIQKKKLLIPSKRAIKFDFRTKSVETFLTDSSTTSSSRTKKSTLMQKLDSRYRIQRNSDDIKAQIEKGHLPIEKLCLHVNNEVSEIVKLRNQQSKDKNEKKYTELQKQKHFDKVYELISNQQIAKTDSQEKMSKQESYYPPTQWEMEWSYLSKIRFTNEKKKNKERSNHHHSSTSRIRIPPLSQIDVPSQPYQSPQLKSNFSTFEIDQACKLFAREFYLNPKLSNQLNLNEEQFYFLMNPDYRQHVLEKKFKDQQLQERILNIIRSNPLSMMQTSYQQGQLQTNPINHMIQTNPEFQQKIQQYQNKIVKSQHLSYYSNPISVSSNDNWLCEEKSRSYSLFDQYEDRMLEIQYKRSLNYSSQNKSDFDTADSSQYEVSSM